MTISFDTSLIIVLCLFVFFMYLAYRIFRYLDYEQRHNQTSTLTINNIPDDKFNDIKLKEWDK